jgi:hypothetical protein
MDVHRLIISNGKVESASQELPRYRSAHVVLFECNDLSLLTITSEERSAQYRGTFEVSPRVSPRAAPH